MHPVEDIGISPWPVDVVEFGADAYAHRKQVDVRQLVPQTAWGSSVPLAVGDRMPAEWEPAPDKGLGPLVTHGWAAQPEWGRSAAMVRRNLVQYVAVCPRLQLTSHTQPISTLSRIKSERYIFYKEVCSFVHWSSSLLLTMFLHIYLLCSCMCLYNICRSYFFNSFISFSPLFSVLIHLFLYDKRVPLGCDLYLHFLTSFIFTFNLLWLPYLVVGGFYNCIHFTL